MHLSSPLWQPPSVLDFDQWDPEDQKMKGCDGGLRCVWIKVEEVDESDVATDSLRSMVTIQVLAGSIV